MLFFHPLFVMSVMLSLCITQAHAADSEILRPRVPADQLQAVRSIANPLPATAELIARGKTLFEGKAFCRACHGQDGKGLSGDIAPGSLKGPLPRNFTDQEWQKARTDGELFWILQNGSKGTAMATFIPSTLTEEEAWQVLLYVRSFGRNLDSPTSKNQP